MRFLILPAFTFFLVLLLLVFTTAIFSPGETIPASRPDSILFHQQYYLLEKALSDSSLKENREQIKINMERWKALPRYLGEHYLFVNTADFRLDAVENDSVVMDMKVVVGRYYRRTPVFRAKLTHIVFNPSWNIPPNILKKDILPEILKDSLFTVKNHIEVFQKDSAGTRRKIRADTINWKTISLQDFPYELVQEPCAANVLGVAKFIFPNKYNVYMHDTPYKNLFEKTEPAFSSGCIRLSDATGLAIHLLKDEKNWNEKRIKTVIGTGKTFTVFLGKPLEVYVQYFTAWVDTKGKVQFRKDIYNRDIPGKVSGQAFRKVEKN